MDIKEITLEILKPSDFQAIDLMSALERVKGVRKIEISLVDFERHTDTLKLGISGDSLDFAKIEEVVSKAGGVIQAIQHIVGENV
ncbi:MAG: DUF211 domain-containing protein [Candidatus Micrarchaeota archaeon]